MYSHTTPSGFTDHGTCDGCCLYFLKQFTGAASGIY